MLLDATKILRIDEVKAAATAKLAEVIARATPPGYNEKLEESVMLDGVVAGYETGVETAGNRSLDKAPVFVRKKKGWVTPDELSVILSEAVDASGADVMTVIEREVSLGLS